MQFNNIKFSDISWRLIIVFIESWAGYVLETSCPAWSISAKWPCEVALILPLPIGEVPHKGLHCAGCRLASKPTLHVGDLLLPKALNFHEFLLKKERFLSIYMLLIRVCCEKILKLIDVFLSTFRWTNFTEKISSLYILHDLLCSSNNCLFWIGYKSN